MSRQILEAIGERKRKPRVFRMLSIYRNITENAIIFQNDKTENHVEKISKTVDIVDKRGFKRGRLWINWA